MERQSYFLLLAESALVDGEIQEEEIPVLRSLAWRLGLKDSIANELVRDIREGRTSNLSQPAGSLTKTRLVRDLIKVIAADKILAPEEMIFMSRMCAYLGVSAHIVAEEMQSAMNNREETDITASATQSD